MDGHIVAPISQDFTPEKSFRNEKKRNSLSFAIPSGLANQKKLCKRADFEQALDTANHVAKRKIPVVARLRFDWQ